MLLDTSAILWYKKAIALRVRKGHRFTAARWIDLGAARPSQRLTFCHKEPHLERTFSCQNDLCYRRT